MWGDCVPFCVFQSQYRQVYEAVAMFLQCGVTVYPVSLLPTAYANYYSRQAEAAQSKLEKEYQVCVLSLIHISEPTRQS